MSAQQFPPHTPATGKEDQVTRLLDVLCCVAFALTSLAGYAFIIWFMWAIPL